VRQGLVGGAQLVVGEQRFIARSGPVRGYTRTVRASRRQAGGWDVAQAVEYRIAVPLIGWLLALPARRALGRIGGNERPPWWGPPDLLDERAWAAIGALVGLVTVIGYLSTLLTQTITYSALEFHAGTGAEGVALAVVRADVVISIALVAVADRHGRRRVALGGAAAGCLLTACGALAPSLAWLAASQVLARGFVTASSIAVAVLAAEAMPKGARAWALGIIAMATAIGGGVCVLSLPAAGLGLRGWRLLYAGALAWLVVVGVVSRRLAESDRYQRHAKEVGSEVPVAGGAQAPGGAQMTGTDGPGAATAGRGDGGAPRRPGPPHADHEPSGAHRPTLGAGRSRRARGLWQRLPWGRRLLLLAAANFLFGAFVTPASQFQNEYLRRERAFSPGRITLFTVLTVLPGAIGIVVGGRLADTRGRRGVGTVAVLGAALGGVLAFSVGGWPMWVATGVGSLTGAAVIPALSVYGPELFATHERGAANGLLTGAGRVGSVLGLLVVGVLSQWLGHFGPAFAILAVGPVVLVVLIVVAFPETAHRSLEELNPGDAGPGDDMQRLSDDAGPA